MNVFILSSIDNEISSKDLNVRMFLNLFANISGEYSLQICTLEPQY